MWETPNDCRFVSISLPLISRGSEYFNHSRAEVMDSDWLLSLLHTFVTERFPSAEGGFWCIIKKVWFGLKTVDVQFDQLDLNDPSDLHFLFLIFFFIWWSHFIFLTNYDVFLSGRLEIWVFSSCCCSSSTLLWEWSCLESWVSTVKKQNKNKLPNKEPALRLGFYLRWLMQHSLVISNFFFFLTSLGSELFLKETQSGWKVNLISLLRHIDWAAVS